MRGGVHPIPGVYNPIGALLADRLGFEAVYLSGAALSGSLGLPDIGLITLDELVFFTRRITSVTKIPLIVDADTGFGEPINVMRAVRELIDAGASAIQIEDQVMPKRCGHLDGKEVIDPDQMVKKIKAALIARGHTDTVIIARVDSRSVFGIDDAIRRGRLYARAGADVIFPEALESEKEFEVYASSVDAPLLANMTEFGKTPYISVKRFGELGYRFVIFPVTTFRTCVKSTIEALRTIREEGTQARLLDKMTTRDEFYEIINYKAYHDIDSLLSG
ncbi:MAG: methylisocitrate lyase [Aigarchaeota archaeon]|nr:methylisocitrate lyase [Aigarchaeota archaeon]MDW8092778.1 methylisocitrate lyase [Nitrososphaerota archaeon]